MSRTAAVAVVALTLVLASVPAAQASPFGPSVDTRTGWLDMALSWLNGFFLFGEETSSPQTSNSTFEAATTTPTLSGGGYTVQSGACIDPAGRPRPCTDI